MKFESFFKNKNSNETEKQSGGVTRRDFLRGAAAVAGGVVLGESANQAGKIVDGKTFEDYRRDMTEFFKEAELRERIFALREEIRHRYNISVLLDFDDFASTSASSESVEELRLTKQIEALETLQTELSKYPDFLITQYGLDQIVITTRSRNHANHMDGGFVTLKNIDASSPTEKPDSSGRAGMGKGSRLRSTDISGWPPSIPSARGGSGSSSPPRASTRQRC